MIKKTCLFLAGCLLFLATSGQTSLTGTVTDRETGEVLPGATLYIPELKTGTIAGHDGVYQFSNLPEVKLLIQVSFIGYAVEVAEIDLTTVKQIDFRLTASAIEAHEVVVTGNALSSDNSRSSFSIVPIGKEKLLTLPSTNLINAIATVPGVAEISTGGAISKPVIRGLSYNRIVTINEGVRQEGNQWGDEHGIEIDPFASDRMEVLKGPASLFYGSDALGGVINILEPVSAPLNTLGGEWVSQASTNNRLFGNSVKLHGNLRGWIWRAVGTFRTAASFCTPDEWVYNSGFRERNFSLMAGVIRKWGYTHLHVSSFDLKPGMIEGERDSLTRQFLDAGGVAVSEDRARQRRVEIPFQVVLHRKIASVTNILQGKNQVRIGAGYQRNQRREYGESPGEPGIHLDLGTFTGDLRYTRKAADGLELAAGASGMAQSNRNRGNEFLVPAYDLYDLGGFVYAKKSWEEFTVNLGMRFDHRRMDVAALYLDSDGKPAPAGDTLFRGYRRHFQAFSASGGMTFAPARSLHFKLNAGRGFRAPNIAELSANGLHEGTFRYETGNPALKPETSLQVDGEIAWEHRLADFSFNGYYNYIQHFIYLSHAPGEEREVDGIRYPVYRYAQGHSVLKGFEVELDIHPVEALHMENSLDYVWGGNLTTGDPLPFIPSLHLTDQVKWTFRTGKKAILVKPFIQLELETHFARRRPAPDESPAPGYTLFNAQTGTYIRVQQQRWTLILSGTNLLNKRYSDPLNRLRERGILNMGRRITVSLIIPFSADIQKKVDR